MPPPWVLNVTRTPARNRLPAQPSTVGWPGSGPAAGSVTLRFLSLGDYADSCLLGSRKVSCRARLSPAAFCLVWKDTMESKFVLEKLSRKHSGRLQSPRASYFCVYSVSWHVVQTRETLSDKAKPMSRSVEGEGEINGQERELVARSASGTASVLEGAGREEGGLHLSFLSLVTSGEPGLPLPCTPCCFLPGTEVCADLQLSGLSD